MSTTTSHPMSNHPGENAVVRLILLNSVVVATLLYYLQEDDPQTYSAIQFIRSVIPYAIVGLCSLPLQVYLFITIPLLSALFIFYWSIAMNIIKKKISSHWHTYYQFTCLIALFGYISGLYMYLYYRSSATNVSYHMWSTLSAIPFLFVVCACPRQPAIIIEEEEKADDEKL